MKFISNMKDDKCSNCGTCCANALPLTKTEINIIRIHVKDNQIQEQKHKNPLTCPFRDDEKRICTIYEVRPYICRAWRCDGQLTQKQNKKLFGEKRIPVNMKPLFFGGQTQ